MALVEVTVWPDTMAQWLAIAALGVGPVGAAFYAWDIGMKRGDIRVLGAASYATPLLSTAFLILAGFAKPSANIAIAAVLIAGGGLIAAKDMIASASAFSSEVGTGSHEKTRQTRLRGPTPAPSPFGASSNFANSNPGATVHPTSVQSPVLSAACHACAGTIACGTFAGGEIGPEPDACACRRHRRSARSARWPA